MARSSEAPSRVPAIDEGCPDVERVGCESLPESTGGEENEMILTVTYPSCKKDGRLSEKSNLRSITANQGLDLKDDGLTAMPGLQDFKFSMSQSSQTHIN